MGLASKLAAFAARLTSDSKVPAAGLDAGAAISNLGYTPVNKAGDTMTGALTLPDGVAASRSALFNNSVEATTSTNRAIGYSTAWTDHLSATITLSKAGPVCVSALFANFYESGAVDGWAYIFISSGNSSYAYSVGQQGTANMGMGSHSLLHIFGNIPAGTYTVTLRVRNLGSGSNWILNNFIGYDGLYVMY